MGSKMMFLLSLLFLSACGQEPYRGKGWSDAFNPYVRSFAEEAAKRGRIINSEYLYGLTVQFGDPQAACAGASTNAIGCCQSYEGSNKRDVVISEWEWEHGLKSTRYSLIFHELGHCLLDEKHRNNTVPGSQCDGGECPASIMNTRCISGDYLLANFRGMLDELFSH